MKKENLIFLTGTLCTEDCFSYQKEYLQDMASITIDTLSDGESVEEMANTILQKLPEEFSLVGFSMGGVIALEMQRQAPERVKAMTLMNVNPAGTSFSQQQTWQNWLGEIDAGGFSKVVKVFKENIVQDACKTTVWDMAHTQGADYLKRQLRTLTTRIDSRPYLEAINCPTLLICGRDDTITPMGLHYAMHEQIPNSSFVSIAGCGHYSPLEQPKTVSKLLRNWLTEAVI